MNMRYPREGYGYGFIRMDIRLMNTILPDANISETTTQGELLTQGVLERCKQALCLPDDYEVMGIYFRYYLFAWDIVVEAPGLPMPPLGEEIRTVVPVYRVENGERKLVRIETAHPHYQVLRVD